MAFEEKSEKYVNKYVLDHLKDFSVPFVFPSHSVEILSGIPFPDQER